jgi:hypothetical protein
MYSPRVVLLPDDYRGSERVTRYSEKAGPGVPTIDAVETPLTASILTVCRRPFLVPAAPLAAVNLADPRHGNEFKSGTVLAEGPGKTIGKIYTRGEREGPNENKEWPYEQKCAGRGRGTGALAGSSSLADTTAFALSGCSGMMQAGRRRIDPHERGAPAKW